MIAEQNESIMEASKTLYNMHCEETVRAMARARQDATRRENMYNKVIADLKVDNEKLSSDNTKLSDDIAKLAAANLEKDAIIEQLQKRLAEKD